MNVETRLTRNERHAFISQCQLADCTHSLIDQVQARSAPMATPTAESPRAAVVGSNLVAFAENVSRQNKEDVMDSLLFATLVANKAFSPESQSRDWYAKFNHVLATLGWFSTNWNYSLYQSTHQRFTMDQVGLEILASAVAAAALPGPATAAMLTVAADAIAAIRAQEKPLDLFERQTKSHSGANFRIGACAESSDGTLHLAMGAVNFVGNSDVTNVLFWEFNSAQVETFRGEDNLVFNSGVYAQVREEIRTRLGSNAKSAIEEFDI